MIFISRTLSLQDDRIGRQLEVNAPHFVAFICMMCLLYTLRFLSLGEKKYNTRPIPSRSIKTSKKKNNASIFFI